MSVSIGSFRDYSERRLVVGREQEWRNWISGLWVKGSLERAYFFFFLAKCLPLNVSTKRLDGSEVITPFITIWSKQWLLLGASDSETRPTYSHHFPAVTDVVANLPWETSAGRRDRLEEEVEKIHREGAARHRSLAEPFHSVQLHNEHCTLIMPVQTTSTIL